jgi:hypothetical protein
VISNPQFPLMNTLRCYPLLAALLLPALPVFSPRPAFAQVLQANPDSATTEFAVDAADGENQAAENGGAAEAAPAAPAAPAADPAAELAKALRSVSFDRSPEALLKATRASWQDREAPPAEVFQMAVMLGDWAAVGRTLAGLPPAEARAIHGRLLATLAEKSVPVGDVLKLPAGAVAEEDPFSRMRRVEQDRSQSRGKFAPLLSEDFYALVEAAPGDLAEDQLPALAGLAKVALGEAGRATLVARLKDGWKGLGGSQPEGRKLAARLLSSLGWISDAAPFLPLDPAAWDTADTTELVFAMEFHTRAGIDRRDERELQKAAEICARLMKSGRFRNYTRPQFRLAMDRLVQLLPALEPEDAQQAHPRAVVHPDRDPRRPDQRARRTRPGRRVRRQPQGTLRSLGTQHLILAALAGLEDDLPANVPVLVMNWLTEAEACYRAGGVVAGDLTQAERMMLRRYGGLRESKIETLGTARILATAPPPGLIKRLNPGLAQRVELTLLKVGVLEPGDADLDGLRAYVAAHPGLAREVCQDFLTGWISKRSKPAESEQVKQMRAYGMFVPPQLLQLGGGIPLTRLRQNENIRKFKRAARRAARNFP